MSSTTREYEIILLGATGYTGKLCAEHITLQLPADLRWAVSGRSKAKLAVLVDELRSFKLGRHQPGVEVTALTLEDLDVLTRKTRVLINTVGPYHLYGNNVVEACVKNGTHYLDVTGESPWVLDMIKIHHKTAKRNKAIIIPEIGVESAPSDLVAWSVVKLIRDKFSVGTKDVISCLHEMKSVLQDLHIESGDFDSKYRSAPSGGTLATLLGLADHYSLKEVGDSMKPWALSPIVGSKPQKPTSLGTKIFGVRSVPPLGTLSTSIFAGPNAVIVQRSWGLLDGGKVYGPKFTYEEYAKVPNKATGVALHFVVCLLSLALASPLIRWLLKKLIYAPGQGPPKELTKDESIEYRAVGTADQNSPTPKRALARFRYDGGIYYLTGLLLAEAAMVLIQNDGLIKELGGGLLTPAMLGQPFVDRLRKVGVIIEADLLPN